MATWEAVSAWASFALLSEPFPSVFLTFFACLSLLGFPSPFFVFLAAGSFFSSCGGGGGVTATASLSVLPSVCVPSVVSPGVSLASDTTGAGSGTAFLGDLFFPAFLLGSFFVGGELSFSSSATGSLASVVSLEASLKLSRSFLFSRARRLALLLPALQSVHEHVGCGSESPSLSEGSQVLFVASIFGFSSLEPLELDDDGLIGDELSLSADF